jgi:flagellar hook-associated protein 2
MGIRFDGLATGFDTTAILNAILDVERLPLRQLERRRAGLEEERELLQQFNTDLLSLRDAAKAIDNRISTLSAPSVDEELLAFVAKSSDEALLTASASENATAGSTEITVNSLAEVSRDISTQFSSATDPIATVGETLSIDYGGDDSIEITVGAAGASLTDLKSLINTDVNNDGSVRADILFDGVGHRLIVSGTVPGVANDVSVSTSLQGESAPDPFFDAALSTDATDASLQVFGVDVTRESNDVSDVIPGVTLQLVGDGGGAGGTATVDVARDDESIAGKIEAVVDGYNRVRDFLSNQAAFNEDTGRAGPLSGDATLRGIESQLQRIVGGVYTFADNPFSSLTQIGVTFDRNGRLSLDTEQLEEALGTDLLAVRELLSGDGTSDGVATALARALEPITQVGDGLLANREQGIDDRIEALDVSIERFERRLEQREDSLRQQFSRLESQVSTLQAQGNFLSNAFA